MAQNVTIAGAHYTDVPAIELNKTNGGTAKFVDTSDASASSAEIASGKTAYVDGSLVDGTMQTIGQDGLTWDEITTEVWGVVDRPPIDAILQEKTINPTTSKQIIIPDEGFDGFTKVTVEAIETEEISITPSENVQVIEPTEANKYITKVMVEAVPEVPEVPYKVITKSLTFSSAVTASQLIWSAAELSEAGINLTDLSAYEIVSILGIVTSTASTYQVVHCNCFNPGYRYSSSTIRYGVMSYHGSSSSSVSTYWKTSDIASSVAGYFYVNANGVYYVASSTYKLYGTYLFTLTAKLA